MSLDKDKIKEVLTKEDIHKILRDLNSGEPKEDSKGNPIYQTVCHSGESHKLYYYQDSCLFHCYTNCGTMDIYELVIKVKKEQGYTYNFYDALKYVAEITGKIIRANKQEEKNSTRISDWDWLSKITKVKTKPNNRLTIFNKNVLDVFLPYPHESWLNEGIKYDVMQKYNIGYHISSDRITIPHFDIDGNLVGIRGRATRQEDIENGRKYMPVQVGNTLYNHMTHLNCYGLNFNKNNIRRLRKVAIFEGEKSVMKVEGYYRGNNFSVATSGSNISSFQVQQLLDLGIEEVIICFDKHSDDATEREIRLYKEKLLRLAYKFTPYVRTYIVYDDFGLLDGNDAPVDKGKEILEELMRNKYEIKTQEVIY